MIDMACRNCGQKLSVPDSLVGKSHTCPGCGDVSVVPGDSPGDTVTKKEIVESAMPSLASVYVTVGIVFFLTGLGCWMSAIDRFEECTTELISAAILTVGGWIIIALGSIVKRLSRLIHLAQRKGHLEPPLKNP